MDLMELSRNARERHPSGVDLSKQVHGIAQSEHTVFINDQTVTSSTAEELNAMQKMAQEMNDKIAAEMKRRDPGSATDVSDTKDPSASPNIQSDWDAEHSGQAQTGLPTASQGESAPNRAGSNHGSNNDQEKQQRDAGRAVQSLEIKPTPATTADEDAKAIDSVNDSSEESAVAQIVSNIVDTAVSSVRDKETTSTADTVAKIAANVDKKVDQEPAAVESALTPVSEAARDGEELSAPVNKPNPATQSGIETPETETTMPDQEEAVSPAGPMDLD